MFSAFINILKLAGLFPRAAEVGVYADLNSLRSSRRLHVGRVRAIQRMVFVYRHFRSNQIYVRDGVLIKPIAGILLRSVCTPAPRCANDQI